MLLIVKASNQWVLEYAFRKESIQISFFTAFDNGFSYLRAMIFIRFLSLWRFRYGVRLLGFDAISHWRTPRWNNRGGRNAIPVNIWNGEVCQGILKLTIRSSARWHWYTIRRIASRSLRLNIAVQRDNKSAFLLKKIFLILYFRLTCFYFYFTIN